MPEQFSMAESAQIVADASLLSLLQFCASGLDKAAWVSADSLLVDASSRDGWINRRPAAIIIDGRDDSAIYYLPPVARADNLIVVVDSLDSEVCNFLGCGGYAPVSVEEISNGRLALFLKQLVRHLSLIHI